MKLCLSLLLFCLASCSTLVTRNTIAACGAPQEMRAHAIGVLDQAVDRANAFLVSEYNLSMPRAHYEMAPDSSLVFVTEEKRWPIRIRKSTSGDLVIWFGFRAQERDDGFVVGSYPPDRFEEIDNSMFRQPDGSWASIDSVASLILHETAHTINGEGTVGYWNTVKYYAEVIFLFRTVNHSDERIPQAVDLEYQLGGLIEGARAGGQKEWEDAYRDGFERHRAQVTKQP